MSNIPKQFTPVWHGQSKDDIMLFNHYVKLANGYCLECQKPLEKEHRYLCRYCVRNLRRNGLEHRRVGYKTVGSETINFQQSLHRKLFGCNAPLEYRGIKEQRIKLKLKQSTIEEAEDKLDIFLSTNKDKGLQALYIKLRYQKNCQKRIMYSLILYCIDYYILESKSFKSEPHFQASLVKQLENEVKRLYIKKFYMQDTQLRTTSIDFRNNQQNRKIFFDIINIIKPILLEIY